jgi:hypothetical protein
MRPDEYNTNIFDQLPLKSLLYRIKKMEHVDMKLEKTNHMVLLYYSMTIYVGLGVLYLLLETAHELILCPEAVLHPAYGRAVFLPASPLLTHSL